MTAARKRLGLAFLIALAAFALYSRSLWSGFVYDAEAQIQHDSYIHTPAHFADVARFILPPEVSKIFAEKPQYIGGSPGAMLQIQPRIWVFLFTKVAWPLHLSADYTPQDVASVFPLKFLANCTPEAIAWILFACAIVVLAVLVAVQTIFLLKSRLALLGTAIFWLGLAPVSNFMPLFRPIADRFLYMPMAGVAATICGALLLARRKRFFPLATGAILLLAIALGCLAWQRQAVFANPLNLWRDTVANSPYSWTAADNLGYALGDSGDYQNSLNAFGRAVKLSMEKAPDPWVGAALTLARMGRERDAETALQKAVALDPRYGSPQELVEAVAMDAEHAAEIEKILARSRQPSPGQ